MKASDIRGKVDFGIITVREDEFEAVLRRFPHHDDAVGGERTYCINHTEAFDSEYLVAALRLPEQGQGAAHDAARDLIADLDPQWLVLVGIGAAVPHDDFTLGDAVIATRVHDFCVEANLEDGPTEFSVAGGPMHKEVEDLLTRLQFMEDRLEGWNDEESIGMRRPQVHLRNTDFYGSEEWQKEVKRTLRRHFGRSAQPRSPRFTARPVASSNRLVKDSNTVQAWRKAARHICAIEMELAGVYRAARRREREYPILAIRGISDIVGFKRHQDWTEYACHSAASFAHALIRAKPITPRSSGRDYVPGFSPTAEQPIIPLDIPVPDICKQRPEQMDELRVLVTAPGTSERCGLTAIRGMGGVGKSILTRQLCDDPAVKGRFRNGIISISMPRDHSDVVEGMRSIGRELGDDGAYYTDLHAAKARLERILASRAVLLIIDDVREGDPLWSFVFNAPQCHLLLTTRIQNVASQYGAEEVELAGFSEAEAVELLADIAGISALEEFSEIAERLGYHPLALQLAATMIKMGMPPDGWLKAYRDRVSEVRLSATTPDPYQSIERCIDLSTKQLGKDQRLLYHSLGIFPEHHWIPRALILNLWKELSDSGELEGIYDASQFDELLRTLVNLSLAEVDEKGVTIHDLLHDYNRLRLGEKATTCHGAMLRVLNPENEEWHLLKAETLGEYNRHACRFLPHHMEGAGQEDDLWAQFRCLTDYMDRHCDKPDLIRESFLTTMWHSWWKKQEEEAKAYLIKKWLARKIPAQNTGYTARTIAVRCAGEVGCEEGLADALCHTDERIRAVALNYMYSLSHQIGGHGFDDGVGRALGILETVASRVSRFSLVPNFDALRSILPAIIVVAADQYRRDRGESQTYERILAISRDVIENVTKKTVLRMLGTRGRLLVARLLVSVVRKIFSEAQSASPNNLRGLDEFFSQPAEIRGLTLGCLRYLDRTYGSTEELQDIVPRLLFSSGGMTADRVTGLVAEGILIAHGVIDPTQVAPIVQEIAERDDGNCLATFCASHTWYVIMDRQPREGVTDEAIGIMRRLVSQWIDATEHNYGVAKHMGQSYQVYPLAYYAALWTKAKPGVEVDLLNEYASRAEEPSDEKLQLHIVGSFGDFRQMLHDYPIALKVIKPYLQDVKPGQPMWQKLVTSLGSLYSLSSAPVERLLEESRAPEELKEEIAAYSHYKPVPGLYVRTYQILADIVVYSRVALMRELVRILEDSLKARDLGTCLGTLVNEVVDLILNYDKRKDTGFDSEEP